MPEYSKSTAISTSAVPMSTSTTLSDVPSVCAACEVQSLDALGPLCLSSLIVALAYEFPRRSHHRDVCFICHGFGSSAATLTRMVSRSTIPFMELPRGQAATASACRPRDPRASFGSASDLSCTDMTVSVGKADAFIQVEFPDRAEGSLSVAFEDEIAGARSRELRIDGQLRTDR